MTTRATHLRRSLAAIAAGACAILGVGAWTIPAQAADPAYTFTNGSIIVHKYANPGGGSALPDGSGTTPTTDPVDGVKFTVAQVEGINLADGSGWTAVGQGDKHASLDSDGKNVTGADGKTYAVSTSTSEQTTAQNGTATFSNLDLGLYVVTETDDTGATVGGKPVKVLTKSAPFLVTVPYLSGGSKWVNDVNVYPKNTVSTNDTTPVKTTDTTGLNFQGDTITWTITQTVPQLGQGEKLKTFKISDPLPSGVNKVSNNDVTVTIASSGGVSKTVPNTVSVDDPNKVTVDFAKGLGDLASGDKVTVTIRATVNDLTQLANSATTTINDTSFDSSSDADGAADPTTVTSQKLTVVKNAQGDESTTLPGAVFTVYPGKCANVTGESTGHRLAPTDANGETSTWAEGQTDAAKKALSGDALLVAGQTYCVKETTAPAGYQINPTGQEVVQGAGPVTKTFTDTKVDSGILPNLPMTGAQGLVLLTVLGLLVAGTGAWFGVVAARRKQNDAE
ncbi:MAG: SpaH/EbpB family LPXTG-anchored major pilin [Actinomycetaceae bacterium]|nr:SpaH/EbpB family LPXTG-anchored major pilin [Actinomycetaceae bacterium]MDY6083004.1 SpaH/EbpB family LPXTG-anchored major pilin [Actinomycetaceae bacterium]